MKIALNGTQINSLTNEMISDLTHTTPCKSSLHVNLFMLTIKTMMPTSNSKLNQQNW